MNPITLFCLTMDCPARGKAGQGNIKLHSKQKKRYRCSDCQQTFSVRKGTLFYGLRTSPEIVMCVIILMANCCPVPAIVKAFGVDERTVRSWWQRAGKHCELVHGQVIGKSQLDLEQVQADEIKAKIQRGTVWIAMAMMVPTRLWLGGVISAKRDKRLIQALAAQVRQIALCRALLLAVDGLSSYVGVFQKAFRTVMPRRRGERGRPQLVPWTTIGIVQVVKRRIDRNLSIERRIVQGTNAMVDRLITQTQGHGVINTAYIERLNATFRQRLSVLTRRTRHLAHKAETLHAGMFVVGCFYNFCDNHKSLRLRLSVGTFGHRWVQRTPAMAAGLADHCWSASELLNFKVPPSPWSPPKRRGRPTIEQTLARKRWSS